MEINKLPHTLSQISRNKKKTGKKRGESEIKVRKTRKNKLKVYETSPSNTGIRHIWCYPLRYPLMVTKKDAELIMFRLEKMVQYPFHVL